MQFKSFRLVFPACSFQFSLLPILPAARRHICVALSLCANKGFVGKRDGSMQLSSVNTTFVHSKSSQVSLCHHLRNHTAHYRKCQTMTSLAISQVLLSPYSP